jgi:polar amino acid transport system substrate-binding protein
MASPTALATQLAPTGVLRAAINFGNPVLAHRDRVSGEARGVSVDLASELAHHTALPLRLVIFDAAGKVFEAIASDAWDVAFLAVDPARATEILFTAPYLQIEGGYMVRTTSALQNVDEIDRPGIRVTVASKSAYDLYLTRTLQHAEIVRASTGAEAIALFLREGYETAAGVKNPLARFAEGSAGLRVLPGHFMVIEQAMGMPKGRDVAWRYLCSFVEEMKANGFIADALRKSGQAGVRVAPAADAEDPKKRPYAADAGSRASPSTDATS